MKKRKKSLSQRVRERLRFIRAAGRQLPTHKEFEGETKLLVSQSLYSALRTEVNNEANTGEQLTAAKSIAQLNASAESELTKRLEVAVKHLLPVMEKGRLEEVTVTFDADTGEVQYEFQAAPPPRQKVTLQS